MIVLRVLSLRVWRVYSSRYFLRFHQPDESIEQVRNIVRSRRRFRVSLEAERGFVGGRKTLQRAVEQRRMRDLCVGGQRGGIDGETVVLRRDHYAAVLEILHRMIRAVMARFHLHGLGSYGQTHDLRS